MGRPRKLDVIPYHGADGYWHAMPTIDGKRWHRKVKDPTGSEKGRRAVLKKVSELVDELTEAKVDAAVQAALPAKPSTKYATHSWLEYWLADVVGPHLSYNGVRNYRYVLDQDILPNLEDVPLPDLGAEHIELMLKKIRLKGSTDKPQRAYDTLRGALNAAVARPNETGMLYNPIKAVRRPERHRDEVTPLSVAEIQRFMAAAKTRRSAARWTVAVALGLRPGEVYALECDDFWLIDRDTRQPVFKPWGRIDLAKVRGVLRVRENIYRRKWLHGCKDPHACGVAYHRYPCPKTGAKHDRYHRDGCPIFKRWCAAECTEHAPQCPDRHGGVGPDGKRLPGGQVRKDPKTEAGKRKIVLPGPITADVIAHLDEQEKERREAGPRWLASGALFTSKWGGILNERDDWGDFQEILTLAKIPRTNPYTSRHSAATMLLLKGVDKKVVMKIMGWTTEAMLRNYQHVVDELLEEAADAVEDLVWGDEPEGFATPSATAKIPNLDEERRKRR